MNKNDIVIEANRLTKYFGQQIAVQDVTFKIPRGKIFGFIGPSGGGKTTTARLLLGLYQPNLGEARVLGHSPDAFSRPIREQIGYMPQLFVLYPELTVAENIHFVASIYGLTGNEQHIAQLLDFVELNPHRRKLVRNISGGMRRRLSLAATLVHNPQVVFLDEPTAGVDPVLRRKFWDYFRERQQQDNHTFFITTQYVAEAAYCDYVGVLSQGRLLAVDTPSNLRRAAFGGEMVDLRAESPLEYADIQTLQQLPFVQEKITRRGNRGLRLVVDKADTAIPELLTWAGHRQLVIKSIEEHLPPFDEVFIQFMNGHLSDAA